MGVLRVWNGSGWDEIKGERGDTGASAYQIAVNEGFVGTEEEWLESLAVDPADIEAAVDTAIDAEPRIAQLVTDVSAVTTTTDVLAALRFDPEHPNYGAIRDDAEPDPATKAANQAAIQLAADDAFAAKGTLVLKGTYWIDATVTFRCHVDGAGGEILVSDTTISPAVAVGVPGVNTSARKIDLPRVRQMGRVGTGWGGSSDIGVRISNTNQCKIYIPYVRNFRENIQLHSASGGHAYNEYSLGILLNGRYNLNFKTGAGGWVNENLLIGGRFAHDSSEGTNISGVRHIRIPVSESGHPFNNNYFLKPSIEGDTPEYHVEAGGMYNTITQGRWEASPPKVLWGDGANGWVIEGGYDAQSIQFTGAAASSRVVSRQNQKWHAGGGANGILQLANFSSAAMPVMTVMATAPGFWTKTPATDYTVAIGALYTRFKREADAHPRIEIDSANGAIRFGNGLSAPDAELARSTSANTLRLGAGDDLYLDGQWNGSRIRLGSAYLWVDGSGNMRKKTSAPTSDTDGTIIG